jgi:hypothetical protein
MYKTITLASGHEVEACSMAAVGPAGDVSDGR